MVFAFLTIGISSGIAVDKVNKSKTGVAIRGFDTVAFHTEKRAVKGKKDFSFQWNDATWYFKSAENRDLFAADPLLYAPQFGGNWPAALSEGQVARGNPHNFKVIDEKLYFPASVRSMLTGSTIKSAESEWKQINKNNWRFLVFHWIGIFITLNTETQER